MIAISPAELREWEEAVARAEAAGDTKAAKRRARLLRMVRRQAGMR